MIAMIWKKPKRRRCKVFGRKITRERLSVEKTAREMLSKIKSVEQADRKAYEANLEYQQHLMFLKLAERNLREMKSRKVRSVKKLEELKLEQKHALADALYHRETALIARYVLEAKKGHPKPELLRKAAHAQKAFNKLAKQE